MAKKLRDEFRGVIRTHHYSYQTGETYWNWVKRGGRAVRSPLDSL